MINFNPKSCSCAMTACHSSLSTFRVSLGLAGFHAPRWHGCSCLFYNVLPNGWISRLLRASTSTYIDTHSNIHCPSSKKETGENKDGWRRWCKCAVHVRYYFGLHGRSKSAILPYSLPLFYFLSFFAIHFSLSLPRVTCPHFSPPRPAYQPPSVMSPCQSRMAI